MRVIGTCLLGMVLVGCLATVPRLSVEADRATFNAIAVEYRQYVENDPLLDESQKRLRINTIDSWDRRIEAHEEVMP